MAKKGVQLLPPVISAQQMIDIYKILAKVNLQIGTMKSDFSLINDFASIQNGEIIQSLNRRKIDHFINHIKSQLALICIENEDKSKIKLSVSPPPISLVSSKLNNFMHYPAIVSDQQDLGELPFLLV